MREVIAKMWVSHLTLCLYKNKMCPNHLNKLSNGRRTAHSLLTPTLFPATKKQHCFVRGAQGNNLAVAGGARENSFFREKKRGHQACRPKAGSSIAPRQAPCPICQKPDVHRCKEMLRSHLPDLEGKAVKHPGGLDTLTSHKLQGWCSRKTLLPPPNDVPHQPVQGRKCLKRVRCLTMGQEAQSNLSPSPQGVAA